MPLRSCHCLLASSAADTVCKRHLDLNSTTRKLVVRQAQGLGLEVVDLVKDPNAAGPLTRSTTLKSNLDKALVALILQQANVFDERLNLLICELACKGRHLIT